MKRPDPRSEPMAALYRDGYTLKQIGDQYGLTRERVRQILKKHHGMNAQSGGQTVRAARKAARAKNTRTARFLLKHGCTPEQWREVHAIGQEMIAQGRGRYQTPLYAFRSQRNHAYERGIGWELTFWQWWTVWQESGRWNQRGRGQGYVMCRQGDAGPYALGNIFIDLARVNCSERQGRKKSGLPLGVQRSGRRFVALRYFSGEPHRLGSYPTPELAHAAYLAAYPSVAA